MYGYELQRCVGRCEEKVEACMGLSHCRSEYAVARFRDGLVRAHEIHARCEQTSEGKNKKASCYDEMLQAE
ncbi:hypothetical protein DDE01_07070 [Desulfovibrio desulfuricans]|nr:hypothetical protein DDE01_07070 [Desulfovibrio desulfuricans]